MKTSDAVAIAIQHAHEHVTPAAWGQLRHDVHAAQQVDLINRCISTGGWVNFAGNPTPRAPLLVLLDHAADMPTASINLALGARLIMNGSDGLGAEYMRNAIQQAIDSVADLNATSLDLGEPVQMEFVLGSIK